MNHQRENCLHLKGKTCEALKIDDCANCHFFQSKNDAVAAKKLNDFKKNIIYPESKTEDEQEN